MREVGCFIKNFKVLLSGGFNESTVMLLIQVFFHCLCVSTTVLSSTYIWPVLFMLMSRSIGIFLFRSRLADFLFIGSALKRGAMDSKDWE